MYKRIGYTFRGTITLDQAIKAAEHIFNMNPGDVISYLDGSGYNFTKEKMRIWLRGLDGGKYLNFIMPANMPRPNDIEIGIELAKFLNKDIECSFPDELEHLDLVAVWILIKTDGSVYTAFEGNDSSNAFVDYGTAKPLDWIKEYKLALF